MIKYTIMKTDLPRLWDLYSKFEKFLLHERGASNLFQVPDNICGTSVSVDTANKTFISKLAGLYKKLLNNNTLNSRSNDIISSLKSFSNGPHIFKSFNDQLTYKTKLYKDTINNKELIHQIEYQVYDPLLGGPALAWNSPIITFNDTLKGWKFHYINDLLSLKQYIPGDDVGIKWARDVLWPVYKRTLKSKYNHISDNLTNCLVKMSTLSSMDGGITTVYGSIFALVRVGFYTTVWYRFFPFNIDIPPDELFYMAWDYFLNENAIVPGYTKITLEECKDISEIVISIRDNMPFLFENNALNEMALLENELPPLEPAIQIPMDNIDRKHRVGVSLGIIIAFCLVIGLYPE